MYMTPIIIMINNFFRKKAGGYNKLNIISQKTKNQKLERKTLAISPHLVPGRQLHIVLHTHSEVSSTSLSLGLWPGASSQSQHPDLISQCSLPQGSPTTTTTGHTAGLTKAAGAGWTGAGAGACATASQGCLVIIITGWAPGGAGLSRKRRGGSCWTPSGVQLLHLKTHGVVLTAPDVVDIHGLGLRQLSLVLGGQVLLVSVGHQLTLEMFVKESTRKRGKD